MDGCKRMWLKIRSSVSLEICPQDLINRKNSLAGSEEIQLGIIYLC